MGKDVSFGKEYMIYLIVHNDSLTGVLVKFNGDLINRSPSRSS